MRAGPVAFGLVGFLLREVFTGRNCGGRQRASNWVSPVQRALCTADVSA